MSREGIDLMQQLLCEPEDRLGSQVSSSVSRPNSLIVQSRRSGFIMPNTTSGSVDGADLIKVGLGLRLLVSSSLILIGACVVPRRRLDQHPSLPGAIQT